MNMEIFQVFYKQDQDSKLDPSFIPYNNLDNPRPELCEWHAIEHIYQQQKETDLDYWGVVSWKFGQKTGITGDTFIDFVKKNPGYDVYIINPAIINEAVFTNGWEQGNLYHPNLSQIANTFLKKIGHEVDVTASLIDRNSTAYSNYFVASRDFWDQYTDFINKIFEIAVHDKEFDYQVFAAGLSNYSMNKTLPNFAFLVERLLSTYIELNNIKSLGFTYTSNTAQEKYKSCFDTVKALSDLKMAITTHQSDELYAIWDHFRRDFLQKNPGILNLE